jgi:hypothetical protein
MGVINDCYDAEDKGTHMEFMLVQDAVELMRMEYDEMPDLKLSFAQARRLWNLSEELCERALAALIGSGFLGRTTDGFYVRRNVS